MSNETRINLKHLLEDIRDSYSSPIEEVIITELVANALDSGATRVDFFTDLGQARVTCVDNGRGMSRPQFREYHNIASSDKVRGEGIGFAGVGAKLSLILADSVVTETRGPHGGRCASEWRLSGLFRAPWKFVPSSDTIPHPRGSSVSIVLPARPAGGRSPTEKILGEGFIERAIIKHFYPLLNHGMNEKILRHVYKKGVEFFVNGRRVVLPDDIGRHNDKWFEVRLPKQRRPIGYGFIAFKDREAGWLDKITGGKPAPLSLASGLAVSTYGKVIKTGWEWAGVSPKSAYQLVGLVEIPALSTLLTTNKDGFLTDAASLKKYYRFRKAIQGAILPILKMFGEDSATEAAVKAPANMKPLARRIEDVLGNLAGDFPELEDVIGVRRLTVKAAAGADASKAKKKGKEETLRLGLGDAAQKNSEREKNSVLKSDPDGERQKRVSKPGLKLALEPFTGADKDQLGRIFEDTAYINTSHPAWTRAREQRWEELHAAMVVALLLYDFVALGRSPQEFVGRFLSELSKQRAERTLF
ncbi:hypothetical protein EPN28_01650 [Patescibacteria group bacterium]|nr:MAG: hypothetical protein EPN28_01650 [Patescibacteria group bacterium]